MNKMMKLFKKTIFTLVMATVFFTANPVSTTVTDDAVSAYSEYPDRDSIDSTH